MSFAQIALDVPLSTVFDYFAPDATAADIGCRVIVPFGRKKQVGVLLGVADKTAIPSKQIKSVLSIDRDSPRLSASVLSLLHFAADYYHHPIGQTVFSALPPAYRELLLPKPRQWEKVYQLTALGRQQAHTAIAKRAAAQHKMIALLSAAQPVTLASLRAACATATTLLRDWGELHWVESSDAPLTPSIAEASKPPTLNSEQQDSVAQISAALDHFGCWLLQGITGSGKTEVYLHIVKQALLEHKQVLILVPEISLTPQLEARFYARFPNVAIVSLHSGLGSSERYRAWRGAAEGSVDIVLGTRLAVFTELPRLGLIIVDEEHDASFKQQEGLRYSARDLAVFRASAANVPVVLGSATPSLESFAHGQRGHYRRLALNQRAHQSAVLPQVKLIDTRVHKVKEGFSEPLTRAIAARLERGEQSLIFINRRGYAPVIHCRACGWMADCPRCSTRLVFHLKRRPLRCHLCGHVEAAPEHCPTCGSVDLRPVGEGTQRIEALLNQQFPDARILRIDRDSMGHKDAWQNNLAAIASGAADILVGTQMLAKGHDFPKLTLVGIINVDSGLYSTDFRAAERAFALVLQVAGRAGRADHPGEVLIQTEFPGHPLFRAAVSQDYTRYAEILLQERQAAGFPPYMYQALLRVEAIQADAAQAFTARAKAIADGLSNDITVYLPVEASIHRIAGKARYQITVQSGKRTSLQHFLRTWRAKLSAIGDRKVRWAIDVDPIEL